MKKKIGWLNFEATYAVTSIKVFEQSSLVEITSQKGSKTDTVIISMEEAEDIGFINFNKLEKFWQ